MKNLAMLTGLSLFSMSALAMVDIDETFFYGGLAGGGAYYSAQVHKQMDSATYLPALDFLVSEGQFYFADDTTHFSGVGQIQIGTGIRFDFLYLGVEALGQLSNGEFDTITGGFQQNAQDDNPSSEMDFDINLKMHDFEPAIDFKPGFFLSKNTLLYGRIGAAFNEVTFEEQAHYDFIDGNAVLNVESSESENVVGLRLGLGVEHHLHKQFNIFIDYVYTTYGDISLNTHHLFEGTVPPGSGPVDLLFDIDNQLKADNVTKQVVMIGFNYYL